MNAQEGHTASGVSSRGVAEKIDRFVPRDAERHVLNQYQVATDDQQVVE
ncbi:hypothetical protein LCGC14_2667760, partial [marine sediment metagenome]